MRKLIKRFFRLLGPAALACLLLAAPAHAWVWDSGYQDDNPDANQIRTDVTNFNGNLSSTDTTVQLALDTLDNMVGGVTNAEFVVGEATTSLSAELAPSGTGEIPNSTSSTEAAWTSTPTVGTLTVNTEVYDATGWNSDLTVPTKDAVRDKIEALSSSPWQTTSNVTNLVTSGDTVTVGSSTALAKFAVDGDADEITALLQMAAGQTASPLVIEDSTGSDIFRISPAGAVTALGTGTDAMTFGGGAQATMVFTYDLSGTDWTMTAGSALATFSQGVTVTGAFINNGLGTFNANAAVKNGASAGVLSIYEASGSGTNFASFQVPALTADTVYVLPSDDGDANQVLSTNGSGTLDWVAGSSTWETIGDAAGTGTVDFAGFDQDITSSEDGGDILTITNTDADNAADSKVLVLAINDGADANSIFLDAIADADGSPLSVFRVAENTVAGSSTVTIGATGVTLNDDADGQLTFKSVSAGSAEDLSMNLDDTANTVVFASTTGVTNATWTSMSATFGGTAQSTLTEGLVVNNGAGTDADDAFQVLGTGSINLFQVLPARSAVNMAPMASPPSSAASGDLYVDSSSTPDELCFYDGAGWQGISSGTDANCA